MPHAPLLRGCMCRGKRRCKRPFAPPGAPPQALPPAAPHATPHTRAFCTDVLHRHAAPTCTSHTYTYTYTRTCCSCRAARASRRRLSWRTSSSTSACGSRASRTTAPSRSSPPTATLTSCRTVCRKTSSRLSRSSALWTSRAGAGPSTWCRRAASSRSGRSLTTWRSYCRCRPMRRGRRCGEEMVWARRHGWWIVVTLPTNATPSPFSFTPNTRPGQPRVPANDSVTQTTQTPSLMLNVCTSYLATLPTTRPSGQGQPGHRGVRSGEERPGVDDQELCGRAGVHTSLQLQSAERRCGGRRCEGQDATDPGGDTCVRVGGDGLGALCGSQGSDPVLHGLGHPGGEEMSAHGWRRAGSPGWRRARSCARSPA
eukprot:351768-Chlamydomonas_euryale.AAC.2